MAQPYIVIYSASSFSDVGFFMEECRLNDVSTATNTRRVDIVIVDGAIACELAKNIEKRGLIVDAYSRPSDLLANLSKYDKSTRISSGYRFCNDEMNGRELLTHLFESGYTDLCYLTVLDFDYSLPYYVRYISKQYGRFIKF